MEALQCGILGAVGTESSVECTADRIMKTALDTTAQEPVGDGELMRALAAGEIEALGELYRRYAPMVGSAVRRYAPMACPPDVEELVQEVFLELHRTAPRYEEQQRFKAWLYGIAVGKARNFGRTSWLRRKLLRERFPEDLAVTSVEPLAPVRAVEERETIERALSGLPRGQREVVELQVFDGFTGPEIARILGIRPKTVKNRMHLARRALVELLGGNDE